MRKVTVGFILAQAIVMVLMCAGANAAVQNTIYDFAGEGAGAFDPGSSVSFSGWLEVDASERILGGEVLFTLGETTKQTSAFQDDINLLQTSPAVYAMILRLPTTGAYASLYLYDPDYFTGASKSSWDISKFQSFVNSEEYQGSVSSFTARATPIPGAVWLLGTGVAGLAWIRRKFQA